MKDQEESSSSPPLPPSPEECSHRCDPTAGAYPVPTKDRFQPSPATTVTAAAADPTPSPAPAAPGCAIRLAPGGGGGGAGGVGRGGGVYCNAPDAPDDIRFSRPGAIRRVAPCPVAPSNRPDNKYYCYFSTRLKVGIGHNSHYHCCCCCCCRCCCRCCCCCCLPFDRFAPVRTAAELCSFAHWFIGAFAPSPDWQPTAIARRALFETLRTQLREKSFQNSDSANSGFSVSTLAFLSPFSFISIYIHIHTHIHI